MNPWHLNYTLIICAALCFVAIISAIRMKKPYIIVPFSKENTTSSRGWMAISIIMVHTAFKYKDVDFIAPFQSFGAPIVSIFLFLSGYGLFKSLNTKGDEFLHRFITRNLFKLLTPLIIATLAFMAYQYFLYDEISYTIDDLFSGLTPLPYSWFIYELLVLYLTFYCVVKIANNRILNSLATIIFITILYNLALRHCGWGVYWNLSIFAFNTGCVVGAYDIKIRTFLQQQLLLGLSFTLLIVCLLWFFNIRAGSQAFIPFVLYMFITTCGSAKDRISLFLGKYSFEIYLCHGFFVPFACSLNLHWALAACIAISGSVLFAIPLQKLSYSIISKIKAHEKSFV